MKKLKFDLEKAKAGAKLITRDGKPARIICWDFKHETQQLIALIDEGEGVERAVACMANGCMYRDADSDDDLFILEESTIRPYANAEEILEAMKEHGPMLREKNDEHYLAIAHINSRGIQIDSDNCYSFEQFKDQYTWQDGHPCGVEEGGDNE